MIIERKFNHDDHFYDVEIGQCFEKSDLICSGISYVDYGGEDLYMRIEPIKDKNAIHLKTGKPVHIDGNPNVVIVRTKIVIL